MVPLHATHPHATRKHGGRGGRNGDGRCRWLRKRVDGTAAEASVVWRCAVVRRRTEGSKRIVACPKRIVACPIRSALSRYRRKRILGRRPKWIAIHRAEDWCAAGRAKQIGACFAECIVTKRIVSSSRGHGGWARVAYIEQVLHRGHRLRGGSQGWWTGRHRPGRRHRSDRYRR